ncbi:MAG: mycothiol synthase [Frankiaceae bacterium]|jgi:mycothiol synthase|nr:mycothiol synthase [Frankiaceae bacterium]
MTLSGTNSDVRIECTSTMSADDSARVDALATAAAQADGVQPLSDHALMHIRHGGSGVTHVLLWVGGDLAAYAHLDSSDAISGPQAELAVAPNHRASGHGRALIRTLLDNSPDGRLKLWSHGELPVARRLAEGMGFTRTRVLALMGRSLEGSVPPPSLEPGMTLRSFVPGQDEAALLALNNAAFAGHPEQGDWEMADLVGRERESWFDAAGLLLLDNGERLVGFVWTKVHGADGTGHAHEPVGEIYVLGVSPDAHRGGLGRTLVAAGLAYLSARGLPDVILYVDESNSAALALYERAGFSRRGVDVLFAKVPR